MSAYKVKCFGFRQKSGIELTFKICRACLKKIPPKLCYDFKAFAASASFTCLSFSSSFSSFSSFSKVFAAFANSFRICVLSEFSASTRWLPALCVRCILQTVLSTLLGSSDLDCTRIRGQCKGCWSQRLTPSPVEFKPWRAILQVEVIRTSVEQALFGDPRLLNNKLMFRTEQGLLRLLRTKPHRKHLYATRGIVRTFSIRFWV